MKRIEIPPRDGGAPVRVPADKSPKKKASGVLNERHISAQEPLYQQWMEAQVRLEVVFDDGTEILGMLVAYDTYALHLIDPEGDPMLVFKQSLRWIRPTTGGAKPQSNIDPV